MTENVVALTVAHVGDVQTAGDWQVFIFLLTLLLFGDVRARAIELGDRTMDGPNVPIVV